MVIPGVSGPDLVQQRCVALATVLGRLSRSICGAIRTASASRRRDKPVIVGPVEDGDTRGLFDTAAGQVAVEDVATGSVEVEPVPAETRAYHRGS